MLLRFCSIELIFCLLVKRLPRIVFIVNVFFPYRKKGLCIISLFYHIYLVFECYFTKPVVVISLSNSSVTCY